MVSTEIRNVISRLENIINISESHLQNCDTNGKFDRLRNAYIKIVNVKE